MSVKQVEQKQYLLFVVIGSKVHKELESVISNKFLLNDIAKISSSHQTSLVEVLHKIDIYFAPKHTHFFYQAMKARYATNSIIK